MKILIETTQMKTLKFLFILALATSCKSNATIKKQDTIVKKNTS